MKHASLFITLIFASIMSIGCDTGDPVHTISVGGVDFLVEVVATEEARARGLMFREEMDERAGMLFVFEDETPRAFYMKNTLIPLSIAYIDSRGVIREIHDMEPLDPTPVMSRYTARFALELNQGAFDRSGVRVGSRMVLPDSLKADLGLD